MRAALPRLSTLRRSTGSVCEERKVEAPFGEGHGEAVDMGGFRAGKGGVLCFHAGDDGGHVVHAGIDLAAAREGAHPVVHTFGQAFAGIAQQLRHEQPRDHARIAVGEIAEIMVRAHLAAVEGVFRAHSLLDEGMPGFGFHGYAARLFHRVVDALKADVERPHRDLNRLIDSGMSDHIPVGEVQPDHLIFLAMTFY